MAQKIKESQDSADLQHYNDRYSSEKQAQDSMARLQHRRDEDLPAAPALIPGRDPDIWKHPDTVIDRKDVPDDKEPTIRQEAKAAIDHELQDVGMRLEQQQREANPGWDWD